MPISAGDSGSSGGGSPPPSSSGGSGDSSAVTNEQQSVDYSLSLAFFGMPDSMIKQINDMIAQLVSTGTPNDNVYNIIVGEIRSGQIGANFKDGMSWYGYTYNGIQQGMSNGLFSGQNPEDQYRDYVNKVNQFYEEYMGRDATAAEIVAYINAGTSYEVVGKQLEGQSYANAYSSGDATTQGYSWNAMFEAFSSHNGPLTDAEKLALGEDQTGYKTTLGDQLEKQLTTAIARMQNIFRGTIGTPADLQKGGASLKAPSLAGEVTPDTAPI